MKNKWLLIALCVLLGCYPKPKPPEPIIVEAPVSVAQHIDPKDSTYLQITVEPKIYMITLLGEKLATTDIKKIDEFISRYHSSIDKGKIWVNNSAATPLQIKSLMEMLKRHGIFKFKLHANP